MATLRVHAVQQASASSIAGVILVGDSWNIRHPISGAGMTVALKDVVMLREMFRDMERLDHWDVIGEKVRRWYQERRNYSSALNLFSSAICTMAASDGQFGILCGLPSQLTDHRLHYSWSIQDPAKS